MYHKCRIGDDCHSNFRLQLQSNGVNYVVHFLSQTAGVSQFADGGIKVGQVQWSTSWACPSHPDGEGRLRAACLRNLAVRLALSELATEFEHTSASYSKQVLTYYGRRRFTDCCSCDKLRHQRMLENSSLKT